MSTLILNRVNLVDVKEVTLTARRWTNTYGTTYHSAYVSGLVTVEVANALNANKYDRPVGEDIWIDLVENRFSYGYDRCFEQTGYTLFKEAVKGEFPVLENVGYLSKACGLLGIKYHENYCDVKRKKDL